MIETLTKKELKQAEKEIKQFFQKLDFSVEINISQKEEAVLIEIRAEEPMVLIGERGKVLLQIQRVLRILLNRKLGKQFYLDLDINEYKKKKIQYLKEVARETADKVSLTGQEKILFPMPAYERRIIHLELAGREDITTQSIGNEPERRLVIRPYP